MIGDRRLGDRSRGAAAQERDGLMRGLPDRNYGAENEDEINCAFKQVAFFFFRTNDQRVGGFEAFGGECGVFHGISWLTLIPYAKAVPRSWNEFEVAD